MNRRKEIYFLVGRGENAETDMETARHLARIDNPSGSVDVVYFHNPQSSREKPRVASTYCDRNGIPILPSQGYEDFLKKLTHGRARGKGRVVYLTRKVYEEGLDNLVGSLESRGVKVEKREF